VFIDRSHPHTGVESKLAYDLMSRIAPYYTQIQFFYAERKEWIEKRKDYGINWPSLPAMSIKTPGNNVFALPMET